VSDEFGKRRPFVLDDGIDRGASVIHEVAHLYESSRIPDTVEIFLECLRATNRIEDHIGGGRKRPFQ